MVIKLLKGYIMKNITDKKIQREIFFRRLKWIFSKSGVLSLAFEHFLAMVPATILVPLLVNNSIGASVIDVSLVLFCSGLGTIIFTIISKGNIPATRTGYEACCLCASSS